MMSGYYAFLMVCAGAVAMCPAAVARPLHGRCIRHRSCLVHETQAKRAVRGRPAPHLLSDHHAAALAAKASILSHHRYQAWRTEARPMAGKRYRANCHRTYDYSNDPYYPSASDIATQAGAAFNAGAAQVPPRGFYDDYKGPGSIVLRAGLAAQYEPGMAEELSPSSKQTATGGPVGGLN